MVGSHSLVINLFIRLQDGHEGGLRHFDLPDGLHPLLPALLLIQELGPPVGVPVWIREVTSLR